MNIRQLVAAFRLCLTMHCMILQNFTLLAHKNRACRRRWWVRPINRKRDVKGFYNNLVRELLRTDHEEFFSLFRMWPEQFKVLVQFVSPFLEKKSIRTPLPTELRLAVALLYLSQGGTAKLQHAEFRIGRSTVQKIIHETCRAIWSALHTTVLKTPNKEEWEAIADDFMNQWQFPHCIGAIDGKHMRIQCPPNSGSTYFNYKQFFSMVLMATCDSKYKFTWIDIGQFGSISDGGVWGNTDFAQDLKNGTIDLPDPCHLPGGTQPFPFVFVGDEAFPIGEHMMRPYPRRELKDEERVFNYRLSRARRTIENTFGILTARWQILHKPIRMSPENSENMFKALVCLHNFLMMGEELCDVNERVYAPRHLIDYEELDGTITIGEWRQNISPYFTNLGRLGSNRSNHLAYGLRNYLRDYFVSDVGNQQAPWQFDIVFRGANINLPA